MSIYAQRQDARQIADACARLPPCGRGRGRGGISRQPRPSESLAKSSYAYYINSQEQRLDLTLTCDTVLRKPHAAHVLVLAWLSVVLSVAVHGNSDKDRAEAAVPVEIAHADHTPRVK